MVQAVKMIERAIYNAPMYRPDGIVRAKDLRKAILEPPEWGLPWHHDFLTKWTYGRRTGELYTILAGKGCGKSDFLAAMIAHTIGPEVSQNVGGFFWEGSPKVMTKAVVGKIGHRRFHLPNTGEGAAQWTQEELEKTWDKFESNLYKELFLNDHYGASDWEAVKERCRFLVHACDVQHLIFDPLAALAAHEEDDRKGLDRIISDMAMLMQETNAIGYISSHLRRPQKGEGKPHDEGGDIKLEQARGSGAIEIWTHMAIGIGRNKKHEDVTERTRANFICLKDRLSGNYEGEICGLYYNRMSGIMEEQAINDL